MRSAIIVVLAIAACSRRPEPSPEFAQAQRRRAEIVAAHPSDAGARPEMDEVLQLLARVPPGSADAAAAAELRARIEAERATFAEEDARRNEALAKATRPPSAAADQRPGGAGLGASAEAGGRGAASTRLGLEPGSKLDDLVARAGDCFEKKSDVELLEGKTARKGEAWGLKPGEACAAQHPDQVGSWLLFAGGAFVSASPAVDATTTQVTRVEEEFEAVPLPGGGFGRRTADGTIQPLPDGTTVRPRDAAPASGAARR